MSPSLPFDIGEQAIVEVEQWKQVDVEPDLQAIATSLSSHQVPLLRDECLARLHEVSLARKGGDDLDSVVVREVAIEGVGYKAVSSVLVLLTLVAHYMHCVTSLQLVGAQVAHLLSALLNLFHAKAYQQVYQDPDPSSLFSDHFFDCRCLWRGRCAQTRPDSNPLLSSTLRSRRKHWAWFLRSCRT